MRPPISPMLAHQMARTAHCQQPDVTALKPGNHSYLTLVS